MSSKYKKNAIHDKFFLIKLREENPHLANIMEDCLKMIKRYVSKVDLLNSVHLNNTQKRFQVKLSLHNQSEKCLKSKILEQYKT
jgi:hypothetical protein